MSTNLLLEHINLVTVFHAKCGRGVVRLNTISLEREAKRGDFDTAALGVRAKHLAELGVGADLEERLGTILWRIETHQNNHNATILGGQRTELLKYSFAEVQHAHTETHTHKGIHTRTHARAHTQRHTHMQTHITHTSTHKHTHAQLHAQRTWSATVSVKVDPSALGWAAGASAIVFV